MSHDASARGEISGIPERAETFPGCPLRDPKRRRYP
jgi:hypothetical protein